MKQLYTRLRNLTLLSVAASVLMGCPHDKNTSSTTGWKINDEENGGFEAATDYQEQETGPGLVFIEGGAFTMGRVQDDVMHDWNNTPKKIHVRSFYMDETEVTNMAYREYLYWLKRVFPTRDYPFIHKSALPDTLVWRNRLGANEVFVSNYLRHPAYNNYPVVGVNWIQATKFADWRTDRVNENILVERGIIHSDINSVKGDSTDYPTIYGESHFTTERYLIEPDAVFGESKDVYNKGLKDISPDKDTKSDFEGRHVKMEDGILLPKYRLPTEAEWEFAALALIGNRNPYTYNNIESRKKFPWNGSSAKAEKNHRKYGIIEGNLLANFKAGRGDYKGIAGWSNDGADITNQVGSYPPNDYGLYDMAGNVSEWVADVYRPIIDADANDFSYYRGNVFTRYAVDDKGEIIIITDKTIEYIKLSNGDSIPKNLPGDIARVDVTDEDTYMRPNYSKADNINYHDGDKESSKNYGTDNSNANPNAIKKPNMYNSPDYKYKLDPVTGKPKYDTSKRSSLINDKVRVYKGGSWADRVYWLDPAQRRYMQQDMSSNDIGFRCAMDRVGSQVIDNHTVPR